MDEEKTYSPNQVALLRGFIEAIVLAGLEVAASGGEFSGRTLVVAISTNLLRFLEGPLFDRNNERSRDPLGTK